MRNLRVKIVSINYIYVESRMTQPLCKGIPGEGSCFYKVKQEGFCHLHYIRGKSAEEAKPSIQNFITTLRTIRHNALCYRKKSQTLLGRTDSQV